MRVCDGIWKTRARTTTLEGDDFDDEIAEAAPAVGDDELDGPFDIEDFDDPATATVARLDLGSVLIPMPEAGQVQVELTEGGVPSAVWVVTPNGRFTVAAYAAPKSATLWREVATELADSLRKDASEVRIEDGPWGREVVGAAAAGVVRFIGVDGYRWMIRCVVNGPQEAIDALSDRGAGSIGGHRCSPRRYPAAGAHPASRAVARADGRAAAGRRRAGRPTGRSAAGTAAAAADGARRAPQ